MDRMSAPAAPALAAGAPWRLLLDDGATHSGGLALDDCLTGRVGQGLCAPVLRLYTYRFCALVGRFQNLASELHLDYCADHGIPVNRRPTGGGAIVMGPEQLGIALMLPAAGGDFAQARALMARFADGLVQGLAALGIAARFRGKNDLEVDGRKLAGLGVFKHPDGGLLYHASLLVDLDVGTMLRVLNTPFEKITDKEIATVAARTSTVRKETGAALTVDAVRGVVAEGFARAFAATLAPGALTGEERAAVAGLEARKYQDAAWVQQTPEVADHFGAVRVKTPAGLLDVRVTLAGPQIKAAFIAGDFIASDAAVAAMEAALRWHPAEPAAVASTLERVYGQRQDGLGGIPLDALRGAVNDAVRQAVAGAAGQYGCFVNPQGQ
jgi:lipoate-protein ligase A